MSWHRFVDWLDAMVGFVVVVVGALLVGAAVTAFMRWAV